jgi:cyanophycinase
MDANNRGCLMLIGGHEDIDDRCELLKLLIQLSGAAEGELVICTAATEQQETTARRYRDVFRRLGVSELSILCLRDRSDADDTSNHRMLQRAACLFFTGGDQVRITSLLGGSRLDELMHRCYRKGMMVAGTSAGASVMSDAMMVSGRGDDAPRTGMANIAPGFGFLEGIIVDQHFDQRGRIGRLLAALAQNPKTLGVGIDEDTALLVEGGRQCRVLGSQTVTLIDSRRSGHSNVSERQPSAPLAFTDIVVHVLPEGYGFSLDTREPILPEDLDDLEALCLGKEED